MCDPSMGDMGSKRIDLLLASDWIVFAFHQQSRNGEVTQLGNDRLIDAALRRSSAIGVRPDLKGETSVACDSVEKISVVARVHNPIRSRPQQETQLPQLGVVRFVNFSQ